MYKTVLLSLCLFATTILNAQLAYTVHLTEAGTLRSKLTAAGNLASVTNLTVTGNVDARDFATMRDYMSVLTSIDLKDARIKAYLESRIEGDIIYLEDELPASAFFFCSNLKSIILPTSIKTIGHSSMLSCSGLTQLEIPNSVTSIVDSAFYACTQLSDIYISDVVQNIGPGAFINCKASIVVDGANANYSSFEGILYNKNQSTLIQCPIAKTGALTVPSSVSSIGDNAFKSCSGITLISIPTSVVSLGDRVFEGCIGLEQVILPNSVITLGSGVFVGCAALKQVTIPSSVGSIGFYAFGDCGALTSIEVNWQTPIVISPNVFYVFDMDQCTLYVPAGSKAAYQNADGWKDFIHIVEGEGFWTSVDGQVIELVNDVTAAITIHSNTTYNISTSETWLKSDVSSVSGNSQVTITAEPNPSANPRTATVTIATTQQAAVAAAPQMKLSRQTAKSNASSIVSQTITVTQAGNLATAIPSTTKSCLSIYPNPTTDGFVVATGGTIPTFLTIENMGGKVLLSQKVTDKEYIDISHLKCGIYLVNVGGESVKLVKK